MLIGVNIESFKEYMSHDHHVRDLSANGNCSQCGGCCSNSLRLTVKEINRIKAYIKIHNVVPHVIRAPLANFTLDLTCPFLDTSKKTERCKIYAVRPYICQCFKCSDTNIEKYINDPKFMNEERIQVNMRNTFYPGEVKINENKGY